MLNVCFFFAENAFHTLSDKFVFADLKRDTAKSKRSKCLGSAGIKGLCAFMDI